jgi:trimethylamine--corrinoid protein Co-methyltransferase
LARRNSQSATRHNCGFGLNMFTEDDLYDIHCATLEVLQNVGIKVTSSEAQKTFADGGCDVNPRTGIVKIPNYLVEDAITSAPDTLLLAGRDPERDFVLGQRRVGFINFGEGINVIDPFTRELRKSTTRDVAETTLMCDALDQLDCVLRPVDAQDQPAQVSALYEAEQVFSNTTKHCFLNPGGGRRAQITIDMAASIVGSREDLRKRPIFSCNVCPTSPLQLVPECTEVIIECAKSGIPVNLLSMAMAGGSAPVTLAGTLTTHNAEVLSGIVLSQLTRKGAPVIYGSSTTIMDLKYTTAAVGAPELGMINAAVAGLAQYYLLPSWVAGG